MFKKTKKIEPVISQLEKRVCDLESPYKYDIGQKVSAKHYDNNKQNIVGIIVDRIAEYRDGSFKFNVNYIKVEPYYLRENIYKLYVEKEKNIYSVGESELIK